MSRRRNHTSFCLEQTSLLKTKYPFLSSAQIKKRVEKIWGNMSSDEKKRFTRQPLTPGRKSAGNKFFSSSQNRLSTDLFDQVLKHPSRAYDFNLDSEGLSQSSASSSPLTFQPASGKNYTSSTDYFVKREPPVVLHMTFPPTSTILKKSNDKRKRYPSKVSFSEDVYTSPSDKKQVIYSSPCNKASKIIQKSAVSRSPKTRARKQILKKQPKASIPFRSTNHSLESSKSCDSTVYDFDNDSDDEADACLMRFSSNFTDNSDKDNQNDVYAEDQTMTRKSDPEDSGDEGTAIMTYTSTYQQERDSMGSMSQVEAEPLASDAADPGEGNDGVQDAVGRQRKRRKGICSRPKENTSVKMVPNTGGTGEEAEDVKQTICHQRKMRKGRSGGSCKNMSADAVSSMVETAMSSVNEVFNGYVECSDHQKEQLVLSVGGEAYSDSFGFSELSEIPNTSACSGQMARSFPRLTSTPKTEMTSAGGEGRVTRSKAKLAVQSPMKCDTEGKRKIWVESPGETFSESSFVEKTPKTPGIQSGSEAYKKSRSSKGSQPLDPITHTPSRRLTRSSLRSHLDSSVCESNQMAESAALGSENISLDNANYRSFSETAGSSLASPRCDNSEMCSSAAGNRGDVDECADSLSPCLSSASLPPTSPPLSLVGHGNQQTVNRSIAAMRRIVSIEQNEVTMGEISDLSDGEMSEPAEDTCLAFTAQVSAIPMGTCQSATKDSQYWDDDELFIDNSKHQRGEQVQKLFGDSATTPGTKRFLASAKRGAPNAEFSNLFADGEIFM